LFVLDRAVRDHDLTRPGRCGVMIGFSIAFNPDLFYGPSRQDADAEEPLTRDRRG
jgi:hypothetical protein